MQAGVAATLTGLVFVAVSINLSRVLSTPGLVGRAAESILQLLGVVIISTVALIPEQSRTALGIEFVALGAALWITETTFQILYVRRKHGHPRMWAIVRIVQTQLANIPFCVAGVLLLMGWRAGLYWLVPGFAFSLLVGVASAWILLIEILR